MNHNSADVMWEQVRAATRRLLEEAAAAGASRGADRAANEPAVQTLIQRLESSLGPTQREHVIDHGRMVARAAERIGRRLRLSEERIGWLREAGLLHDIGKCAIPEAILAAARPLTTDEREIMDTHAAIGAAAAARLGAPPEVQEAIRDHHTTYADAGVAWARPGTLARIIAVADALVAMTSQRTYAARRPVTEAVIELGASSGGQFDPVVVDAVAGMAQPLAAAA